MTAQIFIALFGVTAVALSQSSLSGRRRWASVFGLLGQPFWFYSAWEAQQWGIFTLCFLYTLSWAKAFIPTGSQHRKEAKHEAVG